MNGQMCPLLVATSIVAHFCQSPLFRRSVPYQLEECRREKCALWQTPRFSKDEESGESYLDRSTEGCAISLIAAYQHDLYGATEKLQESVARLLALANWKLSEEE